MTTYSPEQIDGMLNRAIQTLGGFKRTLNENRGITDGLLIVFEGIDGSGKSTQVENLTNWLTEAGFEVVLSKWNSSDLLKDTVKRAKNDKVLTPMMYCLLHAADMVIRYQQEILPALERGAMVVCDRYIYTSMVRDSARGIDLRLLDYVYKDFRVPDLVFHCVVPMTTALGRLTNGDRSLSYYGAGMDLGLSSDRGENFTRYASLLDSKYNEILSGLDGYVRLNMNRSVESIWTAVQHVMQERFGIDD